MNLVALTSKPSAQFLLVCRIKPFDTPRLRDRIRHINSENSGQLEKLLASSLHSIDVLSTPSLQAAIKIRAKIRFGQNSASNIHIILGKRRSFFSFERSQLAFVDFTLHCTYVFHYLELTAI